MKKCFKCGKTKELDEFYKESKMANGHFGKCKECSKKDSTSNRNKNIERFREYDRQRSKLPHRIEGCVEYARKYRKKHPLRNAVAQLLKRAVRDGKIKKPKICSICHEEKRIMGHHEDYYKPLDVIWVCQICHKKLHKYNL